MSRVVGEGIQDYEIVLTAVKEKVRLIIVLSRFLAQDAFASLGFSYVFYSPWCPKLFHSPYISLSLTWFQQIAQAWLGHLC